MQFITGTCYAAAVEALLSSDNPDKSVQCAVAFWGKGAKKYLRYLGPQSRIICNLESGATNPHIVESMIKKKVLVRTLDNLHAKVYLGKTSVIIGSANCSTNGLAVEEDLGWTEAGVITSDPGIIGHIEGWFATLWNGAKTVRDKDIEQAKSLWKERRKIRPVPKGKNRDKKALSLLEVIRNNPEVIADRNAFVVISTEDLDMAAINSAKQEGWSPHDVYQDWDDIPEGAFLIDAWLENGKGHIQGIYNSTTPHSKGVYDDGGHHEIIRVHKTRNFLGYRLTQKDKALLAKKVPNLWERFASPADRRSGGCIIPLDEAMKVVLGKPMSR